MLLCKWDGTYQWDPSQGHSSISTEKPFILGRWGCSSQHLSKHCSNMPNSKPFVFSFLSWTVTESWYRHIPVFCCWGSWMLIIGQRFLLLFSLFENNNSCWGALASGRLWLHVIHVRYVCSQQRSERADKSHLKLLSSGVTSVPRSSSMAKEPAFPAFGWKKKWGGRITKVHVGLSR